jgi:Fe-S cluster assembly protein SufD
VTDTAAERAFARHFAAQRERSAARHAAWQAFLARGLPTTRDEDWRFTSLAPLAGLDFAQPDAFDPATERALEVPGAKTIAIANGRARRDPVATEPLADAKLSPFVALNAALGDADVALDLEPGSAPVHVLHRLGDGAAPLAVHPRVRVRARAGARAVVIEQLVGAPGARGLSNAVTELDVEAGASLDYVQLQRLPETALHLSHVASRQAAGGRLRVWSLALGARLARTEVRARLEGENAELDLLGLYLARGAQLSDHHTTIDHAAPKTTSRELVKGVLDGRGHGVFHGRIHVRPHAQKIDAAQASRALLLADHARVNAKPQLEIYADDVRCSHGATIGQLDPDQLFYLRSRGLDLARARALLTFGFASEVLAALPIPALHDALERELLAWLPSGVES